MVKCKQIRNVFECNDKQRNFELRVSDLIAVFCDAWAKINKNDSRIWEDLFNPIQDSKPLFLTTDF